MTIARRIVAVALLALGPAAFESTFVGAGVDLEDLIVSEPPDGYSLSTDPTALSGAYTMEELLVALGQVGGIPDLDGFRAHARTWDGAEADRVFVLLVETPSNGDAASYISGAGSDSAMGNSPSFETLITGAKGFVSDIDGTIVHAILWQHGRYAVQVVSGSFDSIRGEADVRELARREVDLLEQSLGIGVTVRAAGDDDDEDSSIAYKLGQIVGVLAVVGVGVGIVLFFVRQARRNRKAAALSSQGFGYVPPPGSVPPPPPPGAPPPPPFGS